MSLISGVITRDGNGALVTRGVGTPVAAFNGGTPTDDNGGLVIFLDQALNPLTDQFINGFRYTAAGALFCNTVGSFTDWQGGIATNPLGEVIVSLNGTPSYYVAGLPINASGRLCIAIPT